MFKNLHLKLLALFLAIIVWVLVVSLESTFIAYPSKISVTAFNLAEGLSLTSELPRVSLMLRTEAADILRNLPESEFEAYVDLSNLGAGEKRVPISVTAKNPKVAVVRIEPNFADIKLEPVKEKLVSLSPQVEGNPASGHAVEKTQLSVTEVTVRGAESMVKKVVAAKAFIKLEGKEEENTVKKATVKIYDNSRIEVTSVEIKGGENVDVKLTIVQLEAEKEVGVRLKLTGQLNKSFIENVSIKPAVVRIIGKPPIVDSITFLETEEVKAELLSPGEITKKLKVILPPGISFAVGQNGLVEVEFIVKPLLD